MSRASPWAGSKESEDLPRLSSASQSSLRPVYESQRPAFLDRNIFKTMREHIPTRLFSNRRLFLAGLATLFVIILVSAAKTGSQPPIVLAVSAAANRTLGFGSIKMINVETVLIMEDDVTWDIHIKDVMRLAASHLPGLLNGTGLLGLNPTRSSEEQAQVDPWHSNMWDLITFGHCADGDQWKSEKVKYDDPYTSGEHGEWHGVGVKGGRRMLRRAGGMACTGAYAVSARGAAKLLLRSGFDLNLPVDVIMNDMIKSDQLRAYSIWPPPVVQWRYRDKLGMWGAMGSDIRVEHKDKDRSGWEDAHKNHDIWLLKGETKGLKDPAIKSAWGVLIGHEDD
ncbi:hypothetical protein N0V92_007472 [Colletotrichum tropicale]|nr:hypothetical protein N0V92_007472 [Colletotrichum tropicale]